MKNTEQPVTKPYDAKGNSAFDERTVTTHPAFAQISAARINGDAYLYGSEFRHHGFIKISISRSELHRDLSNDWHFERGEIAEVWLSEAQWAGFISRMNMGGGTPCTLNRLQGAGDIPGLPPPPRKHDQFMAETAKTLESVKERLSELRSMVEASSLSKTKKDEFLKKIEQAGYGVGSNLGFVAKQFGEHMENVTDAAKTEIEAHLMGFVTKTGLAAIMGEPLPFALPDYSKQRVAPDDDVIGEGNR